MYHNILIVCLGNICRSPMAEYVLRHRACEAGMGNAVITASAGTSGWHDGENMHEGTRRVLQTTRHRPVRLYQQQNQTQRCRTFRLHHRDGRQQPQRNRKAARLPPRQNLQTDRPYPRLQVTTTFPIRGTQATLTKPTVWSMPAVWPCWKN